MYRDIEGISMLRDAAALVPADPDAPRTIRAFLSPGVGWARSRFGNQIVDENRPSLDP